MSGDAWLVAFPLCLIVGMLGGIMSCLIDIAKQLKKMNGVEEL